MTSQWPTTGASSSLASGRTRFSSASPWIGEGQFGAGGARRLGDPPGDRAIVGDAHDEAALALQEPAYRTLLRRAVRMRHRQPDPLFSSGRNPRGARHSPKLACARRDPGSEREAVIGFEFNPGCLLSKRRADGKSDGITKKSLHGLTLALAEAGRWLIMLTERYLVRRAPRHDRNSRHGLP